MRSKSEELMLRIREYIESYFERYSSTPTVREIAGAMKIAVSSAHRYLVAMAEKDMVFYENGTLSTPKIRRMNPAVSPAAIVGTIPCGSPEEKEARVEDDTLNVFSIPGPGCHLFQFNCSNPIIKDTKVRQAISYALDRTALVEALWGAMGEKPRDSVAPPAAFGYINLGK